MIVAIGTDDTLASPGSQMNYYQALLDKMGRASVDSFARLFVIPQVGHGLRGNNYSTDGDGKSIPATAIPSAWDHVSLLVNWVEKGVAPGKSEVVTAGEKNLPLCSYPTHSKFISGPTGNASSYVCQ